MKKYTVMLGIFILCSIAFVGCRTNQGNDGNLQSYAFDDIEADWIRNGEPIEFEGDLWYPADDIDTLLDSEVSAVDEYRGVIIFINKVDVRPYERLYTKFGKNKFRYYQKRES